MTLENISASVFERKKPLIELADSVKDKDGAVSFLRYNYLSIKEAEESENYELAAAIKEEMVKVWNKYKKEIKELMYNMETGELVDVLLDDQGAKKFIKHGEFINLQENYLWGDRQLIDESEYKDYLLTDDLDSVWSQFDEQYQFLNKVDDLRNQSGAIARTEKLDLVIKLNSIKDVFADFQKIS
jgi:TusA-related sulfurtransferase